MSGLSVRQRETLAEALHDADCVNQCQTWPCDMASLYRERAKTLAPVVAGMLDQAAANVRERVEAAIAGHSFGPVGAHAHDVIRVDELRAALEVSRDA